MSDTTPCSHYQLIGQREFCPDCGLSRAEVLVESCAPFLKDDETPAECIRRNRKDVDGCLTLLIAEKRKNEALRAERDEAVELLREIREDAPYFEMPTDRIDAFLAKVTP